MLPHHQPDHVRIAFDDHRLVANAGLILPSTPVYPGVGGEPTPDDIGPGQVSKPVVRPGPARHVPSRALDFGGAQHTPSAPGSVLSNHTNRNYARAWTAFSRWCGNRGIPALPARPGDIVMYLDKMAGRGRRVTTIRAARAAISHGHRTAGYADPTADACVKAFLSGLAESDSRPPHQAKPLTEAVMAEILATALKPRRTSGCAPRLESTEDAERRGKVDIALVSLLRDALLSRSEAAALRWGDMEWLDNNTGRIFVKRRKTDRGDLWKTPHISEETVSALKAIMPVAALINAEDRIFGLSESQVGRRVRQSALAAGLGDGFSGNSGRVGKVQDLSNSGLDIPGLMAAGRWKSAVMPARYIKKKDDRSEICQDGVLTGATI